MLTWDELTDAVRGMVRRASVVSLDGSDPDHLRGAFSGMVGHQPKNIPLPNNFGFYSEPPAGSSVLLVALGGRQDAMHAIAADHPQYRPPYQGGGASVQYDVNGNSIVQNASGLTITGASKIVLQVDGCSLTITASGFAFAGGTIKHDGHLIDKTHVHTEVSPGLSDSGPPP